MQLRSLGIASGLDLENLIGAIIQSERAPVTRLQQRQAQLNQRQIVWRDLRSRLMTLEQRAADLRRATTFRSRSVSVGDKAVVSATANASAAVGSYQLTVQSLATAHTLASGAFASAGAALGLSGTVEIAGAEVTIDAGDSLTAIRDRIHAQVGDQIDVRVAQVADGAHRLILTARTVGNDGAITLVDSAGAGATGVTSSTAHVDAVLQDADTAAAGLYRVSVQQLAASHQVASDYVDDMNTYTGSVDINGTRVDFAGETIEQVRAKLDAVGGISVSTEAGGGGTSRLVITAGTTGAGSAIEFGDPDGLLQAWGVLRSDNSIKHEQVAAQNAVFTVNGQSFSRGYNDEINDVIKGVALTLVTTGSSDVEVSVDGAGVLRSLGLLTGAGTEAHTVAAAQNARFTIDGVAFERAANTVSDALSGVTLALAQTGSSTLTVQKNLDTAVAAVQGLVEQWNNVMNFIDQQTEIGENGVGRGPLAGEHAVRQIRSDLRNLIFRTVPGMPEGFANAIQVGLSTGRFDSVQKNRLVLDTTTLRSKLEEDADAVARLFGALRENVAAVSAGGSASANFTEAGYSAQGVIDGRSDPDLFGPGGTGWFSGRVPPAGDPDQLTIDFGQIRNIDTVEVYMLRSADFPAADHALRDYTVEYQDEHGVWREVAAVTDNQSGVNTVTFDAVDAKAIRLSITATNDVEGSKVLEVAAYQQNQGIADRLFDGLRQQTNATTGVINGKTTAIDRQLQTLQQRIAAHDTRLEAREKILRQRFLAMEQVMNQLQAQESFLSMQIKMLEPRRK